MQLKELLRMLRTEKDQKIIVTGPRASGTKLSAYILAQKLGLQFIAEEVFKNNDMQALIKLITKEDKYVIQAPEIMPYVDRLPEDVLIIVMDRELADILKDQRRFDYDEADQRRFYKSEKIFKMNYPLAHIQYEHMSLCLERHRRVEYLEFDSLQDEKEFLVVADRRRLKKGQIFIHEKTPKRKDFTKGSKK